MNRIQLFWNYVVAMWSISNNKKRERENERSVTCIACEQNVYDWLQLGNLISRNLLYTYILIRLLFVLFCFPVLHIVK